MMGGFKKPQFSLFREDEQEWNVPSSIVGHIPRLLLNLMACSLTLYDRDHFRGKRGGGTES